jgi:hypothetical protein
MAVWQMAADGRKRLAADGTSAFDQAAVPAAAKHARLPSLTIRNYCARAAGRSFAGSVEVPRRWLAAKNARIGRRLSSWPQKGRTERPKGRLLRFRMTRAFKEKLGRLFQPPQLRKVAYFRLRQA